MKMTQHSQLPNFRFPVSGFRVFALLAALAIPHAAMAQTWSGSSSNAWGTASNWTSALPVSGGSLTFNGTTGAGGLNLNNNLTSGAFSINGITFSAGAAAFVIGDGTTTPNAGNPFVLAGSVTNSSTNLQTINNPFSMTAQRTFTTTAGGGNIRLGGNITGTGGGIQVSGPGAVTLAGDNSFTGSVTVATGTLNLASATALGSGTLTMAAGATIDNTSGSALTLTTNNPVSWATNAWTFGGTNNLTFGSGAVTASGGGITVNGTGRSLTFGGSLTNTATSNTGITFVGEGNKVVFGGLSLNADTVGAKATTISGTADVTFAGPVVGGGRTDHILQVSSSGTITLQGANTWTGILRTSGPGTILIDANTATFSAANALGTNMGGTINYDNTTSTGARSVTFGAMAFGGGEGTLQTTRTSAQNVSMTIATNPSRTAGATGNIVVSGGTNGVNNGVIVTTSTAGFINGGIYFNGANFAATSGSGTYIRALNYGTDTNAVAVNTITASRHVKLTSTPASQAGISLLTLNLSGNTDFTLSSGNLTLSSSGLLKSGGGSSTISGGSGISQTVDLVVRADTAGDLLTISNAITSTSASNALTKSGAGTVVLGGTNSFVSGAAVAINNGALRATDGVGLPSTSILALRGGVLESSGTFNRTLGTAAGNVNWSTAGGGFAANGGALNVQLNGGTSAIAWNSANMTQDYRELIFGSVTADNRVDFQNGLTLGTVQRTIRVIDNTGSTADIARISGAITGGAASSALTKVGTGTLELTNNSNAYTGGTVVNAGTLLVNNTSGSGTGTGSLSVSAGAILGGNGSISGTTTISGSLRPGNSIGTLTVTNDVTWNAGDAWVFELGSAATTMALAGNGTSTQDMLNITGGTSDFLKGSGSTWTFDFAGGGALGWYKLVDWAGTTDFNVGLNNQFSATNLGGGYTGAFTVDSATSALYLNVVPEPSTWALLAFSLTTVMVLRRRRNS
jgi:autotransporter-associated beta strand protein